MRRLGRRRKARGSRRSRRPGNVDLSVALLLTVAAAVTAVVGARAALVGDEGSDTSQRIIREDVEQGAAIVENARLLYGAEGPAALDAMEARLRSEELRRVARQEGEPQETVLEAEALARAGTARLLVDTSPLLQDPSYAAGARGFDMVARLAAIGAENPAPLLLDPDATEARAAELSRKSSLLSATAILAAAAFLLAALAQGFPTRRRVLVGSGYLTAATALGVAVAVELVL